uniref:FHA domain-containing protein n=1 Tax=Trichuris muris TaxID=70415 RepID=A0A5S6Q356_TRIMR
MDMGEACIILSPCQQSHPFEQRRACVVADDPIKIGRAVAKVQASADNFIFDCKVLSRTHAVLWYEDGSFFIKTRKAAMALLSTANACRRVPRRVLLNEVFSGDIVQLGVEIVENTKNGGSLTHGCIVAMLRLYHPNGMEALKRECVSKRLFHLPYARVVGFSFPDATAAGAPWRVPLLPDQGPLFKRRMFYQMQLHLRVF